MSQCTQDFFFNIQFCCLFVVVVFSRVKNVQCPFSALIVKFVPFSLFNAKVSPLMNVFSGTRGVYVLRTCVEEKRPPLPARCIKCEPRTGAWIHGHLCPSLSPLFSFDSSAFYPLDNGCPSASHCTCCWDG